MKKLSVLRDKLIDGILERIPYSYLNGPRGDKRLPGNVNVRFTYIEGESILLSLRFWRNMCFKWKCLYIRFIRSITCTF